MALTLIQRGTVETLLGVKPRGKGEKKEASIDKKIVGAMDDYERREGKVIEAIKALEAVKGTAHLVAGFEQRVIQIRQGFPGVRDGAPKAIEAAYKALEDVKEDARKAASLATKNADFYTRLDIVSGDYGKLENHGQSGAMQKRLVDIDAKLQSARDAAEAGDFTTAEKALGDATDAARNAKEFADGYAAFLLKVAEGRRQLDALRNHAQRAHVKAETDAAALKLTAAVEKARANGAGNLRPDFSTARSDLTAAAKSCSDGTIAADRYAAFVTVRADAIRYCNGIESAVGAWDTLTNAVQGVEAAAVRANTKREYDDAEKDIADALQPLKTYDLKPYVLTASNDADVGTLKSKDTTLKPKLITGESETVVAAAIKTIDALILQRDTAVAAGKWPEVKIFDAGIYNEVHLALRNADRRIEYDKAREPAVTDIEKVEKELKLPENAAGLRGLLTRADGLASAKTLRFEDAIAEIGRIRADCAALTKTDTDHKAYTKAREEADKAFETLQAADAQKAVGDKIVTIKGLLTQATGLTDVIKNQAGPDWAAATDLVKQAAAQIEHATKLLNDMGGALDAKKKADTATTPAAIEQAIKDLREQAAVARKEKGADAFESMLKLLDDQIGTAEYNAKLDPGAASNALKAAGNLLVEVRTGLADHARFADTHAKLQTRAETLEKSTKPPVAEIQGKIDPLLASLSEASKLDKAHNWEKAGDALRKAEAAATEAELIAKLRGEFDTRAEDIKTRAKNVANPTKDGITAMLEKATGFADKFNLDYANRFLDNAEARLSGEDLKSTIATKPLNETDLLAAIEKMLKASGGEELLARATDNPSLPRNPQQAGKRLPAHEDKVPNGPELLDEIVKGLGDDVDPAIISTIAEKRFGLKLKVSALTHDGTNYKEQLPGNGFVEPDNEKSFTHRSKTARHLYNTLAMTPEQARNNPMLKGVERRNLYAQTDAITNWGDEGYSGFYERANAKSVMKGRPQDNQPQPYGRGLNTSTNKALPDEPTDPKEKEELAVYEPAPTQPGKPEPLYFDHVNVHETGHAVDDRLGFMDKHLGNAAYGGWTVHKAAIDPIATAVVGKYGAGLPADALKQFVTDLILNGKAERPPVTADLEVTLTNACNAIETEWYANAKESANPWDSQGKSDLITIGGVIYQEAYKNNWVSYPAAERKKGISGYQFRAPGEWFSELYAAYHMEKLKPGHPARKWLSSMSL